jgi:hypothetical protein
MSTPFALASSSQSRKAFSSISLFSGWVGGERGSKVRSTCGLGVGDGRISSVGSTIAVGVIVGGAVGTAVFVGLSVTWAVGAAKVGTGLSVGATSLAGVAAGADSHPAIVPNRNNNAANQNFFIMPP